MKASNLLRGARKGLQIYVVKLNKVDDPKPGNDPEWLSEFRDIFPEKLTQLPPSREVSQEVHQSLDDPIRCLFPRLLS